MMIVVLPVLRPRSAVRLALSPHATRRPDTGRNGSFPGRSRSPSGAFRSPLSAFSRFWSWSRTMRWTPMRRCRRTKPPLRGPGRRPRLEMAVHLSRAAHRHRRQCGLSGRPAACRFRLTSDTVMQSFFIPALGSQIYAMAGMVTQLNLKADRAGTAQRRKHAIQRRGLPGAEVHGRGDGARRTSRHWVAKVRPTGMPLDRRRPIACLSRSDSDSETRAALARHGRHAGRRHLLLRHVGPVSSTTSSASIPRIRPCR